MGIEKRNTRRFGGPLACAGNGPLPLPDSARIITHCARAERCLAPTLTASEEAILSLSLDGTILSWSAGARNVYGYEAEAAVGHTLSLIFEGEQLERARELIAELKGAPGMNCYETTGHHLDGHPIQIRHRLSSILDGSGKQIAVLSVSHDLSEQRRVESDLNQAELRVGRDRQRLRALASELVLAEEHERSQLAQDLHDHLSQLLSLAKIKLESLLPRARDPALSESLQGVTGLIDQMLRSVRTMTFELNPSVLHDLGLAAAVDWLAKNMAERYDLDVQLDIQDVPLPLSKRLRVILFRSIRELLINVSKHAQASHAVLSIHLAGPCAVVTVQDDGIGFDPACLEACRHDGFGLFSIRERLDHLGGSMLLESTPGEGARITLTAELSPNEVADEQGSGCDRCAPPGTAASESTAEGGPP
jgi:PAS domain S-box-containing protein